MRTRKVRKSKKLRRGGFKYTNPTGSNLNLRLYSKQVGGSCKEAYKKVSNSSCRKLCHSVGELPSKEFEYDIKYKISALKPIVDGLKQEHRRVGDLIRGKYEMGKPIMFNSITGGNGWFSFDVSENKKCIEECEKLYEKSENAICEKVSEIVHPTKDDMIYKFLLEQQQRLKSEIYAMNKQLGRI